MITDFARRHGKYCTTKKPFKNVTILKLYNPINVFTWHRVDGGTTLPCWQTQVSCKPQQHTSNIWDWRESRKHKEVLKQKFLHFLLRTKLSKRWKAKKKRINILVLDSKRICSTQVGPSNLKLSSTVLECIIKLMKNVSHRIKRYTYTVKSKPTMNQNYSFWFELLKILNTRL